MEVKKTAKADLENKKGLFLEIGLTVSILICIFLFGWSQQEKVVQTVDLGRVAVEEDMIEITIQEEKPIEPPKQTTIAVASDILQVVKNDVQVSTEFDFSSEFNEDAIVVAKPVEVVEEEVVEEDMPFMTAEEMPTFRGGDLNAFRDWVAGRLVYPAVAAENGLQGKVILQFVVERDGSIGRIKVLASPDRSLTEEAVRVVTSSPKWKPGKQRGNAVPVSYTLPVDFKLQ